MSGTDIAYRAPLGDARYSRQLSNVRFQGVVTLSMLCQHYALLRARYQSATCLRPACQISAICYAVRNTAQRRKVDQAAESHVIRLAEAQGERRGLRELPLQRIVSLASEQQVPHSLCI
eukprot:1290446-Rhodomonas_salina.1